MAGDTNRDGVLDAQELYGVLMRVGFFNGKPQTPAIKPRVRTVCELLKMRALNKPTMII